MSTLPANWPLVVFFLGVSGLVAQFLWSNFFNVRASLTKDFSDRIALAGTKIIADTYMPRLADLLERISERGVEPGDEALMAELASTEFFGKITGIYEPLRERAALDGSLASLKRRGERVAKFGVVFVVTLPLSYVVILWPVPVAANSLRTVAVTLWLVLFVVGPVCGAVWNLCAFWRDRTGLDETLDSIMKE